MKIIQIIKETLLIGGIWYIVRALKAQEGLQLLISDQPVEKAVYFRKLHLSVVHGAADPKGLNIPYPLHNLLLGEGVEVKKKNNADHYAQRNKAQQKTGSDRGNMHSSKLKTLG